MIAVTLLQPPEGVYWLREIRNRLLILGFAFYLIAICR